MVTTVVDKIGSGETYTTFASWESATDNNLVSDDEIRVGEMTGSESFTALGVFAGATVNATHYRVVRAESGNEYDPSDDSGCKVDSTTYVFYLGESYVRVQHMYLEGNTEAESNRNMVWANSSLCTLDSCYISFGNGTSASGRCFRMAGVQSVANNCIADGKGYVDSCFWMPATSTQCSNCIAFNGGAYGFDADTSSCLIENCVSFGAGTSDFSLTASGTYNNNASSDDTADDQGGSDHVLSITIADELVDYAAGDFRPLSSGQLEAGGKDLSGRFTDDFENVAHGTYSGTWNIGAYDTGVSVGPVHVTDETLEFSESGPLSIRAIVGQTEVTDEVLQVSEGLLPAVGSPEVWDSDAEVAEAILAVIGLVEESNEGVQLAEPTPPVPLGISHALNVLIPVYENLLAVTSEADVAKHEPARSTSTSLASRGRGQVGVRRDSSFVKAIRGGHVVTA